MHWPTVTNIPLDFCVLFNKSFVCLFLSFLESETKNESANGTQIPCTELPIYNFNSSSRRELASYVTVDGRLLCCEIMFFGDFRRLLKLFSLPSQTSPRLPLFLLQQLQTVRPLVSNEIPLSETQEYLTTTKIKDIEPYYNIANRRIKAKLSLLKTKKILCH